MKEEFEKELQELSPFLADLKKQPKNEPFKTPRLYFDTLADKVLEKAKAEGNGAIAPPQYNERPSTASRINNWLSTIFQPRLAFSALGLALLIAAAWFVVNQQKTPTPKSIEPTVTVSDSPIASPKNDVAETPILKNAPVETVENKVNQSPAVEPNATKIAEKKSDIADVLPSKPNTVVPTPAKVTHPKSGLTEEEIESYLKESLDDEDLESMGGK